MSGKGDSSSKKIPAIVRFEACIWHRSPQDLVRAIRNRMPLVQETSVLCNPATVTCPPRLNPNLLVKLNPGDISQLSCGQPVADTIFSTPVRCPRGQIIVHPAVLTLISLRSKQFGSSRIQTVGRIVKSLFGNSVVWESAPRPLNELSVFFQERTTHLTICTSILWVLPRMHCM